MYYYTYSENLFDPLDLAAFVVCLPSRSRLTIALHILLIAIATCATNSTEMKESSGSDKKCNNFQLELCRFIKYSYKFATLDSAWEMKEENNG